MSETENNASEDQQKKEDSNEVDDEVKEEMSDSDAEEKNATGKVKKEKPLSQKSPKKSPAKKIDNSENEKSEEEDEEQEKNGDDNDEDDEEEDDSDEEDTKPGLLDLPLEVSGTRERKKVERLDLSFTFPKDKKADIPEGTGEKLGDCPRIEFQIQRLKSEELKPLHRILYNRPGTSVEIKRNIRRFNGFPFKKDSPDFEKKKTHLDKITLSGLKLMCEVMDLERMGTKDEIIARILEFLLKPKSSGKKVPESKRKSSTPKTQKKKKAEKSKGSSKKTKSKNKALDSDSESNQEEESEKEDQSEKEEESEEHMSEDEESEKEEKKKKTKKEAPKKETKTKAKKEKKDDKKKEDKKEEKKTPAKPQQKKRKAAVSSNDEDSSDDEPLVKKSKNPPTDDELKSLIKKILDGANLEEITMKTVCKQVYAAFPDFDLSDRKEFIKSTVKSIIS